MWWWVMVFLPSKRPPNKGCFKLFCVVGWVVATVHGGTIAEISFLPNSAPVPAKLGGVSPIFDSSSCPSGIVVYQQEISSTCFVALEGLIK
jgi:hypothetical protein